VREIIALVLLFVGWGCAAPASAIRQEDARASCRETATTKERFLLTGGFSSNHLSSGGQTLALSHLDPDRFAQCLRATGVTEASASHDLAQARREEDCRNRAMSTESNTGIVGIAFDPDRYQACMKAAP